MKLRAIELTNVRQFAGRTARIDGISDGLTVLSAPNEFGKSTFFDGLHALFFERYSGRAQSVKRLQPHSGGAPEVAVEVETDSGNFRIEKRWLSKATAAVREIGTRIVAVDDEAEAWIDQLISGGLGGPAGLLWVRQGLLGLEAESKKEQDEQLETRRDLLSSVAGEIDLMTGGRRMDAVLNRLTVELAEIATSTGRPKASGAWDAAQKDAEALATREAELTPKLESLSEALKGRTEAQRRLAVLNDPEADASRRTALTDAQAAHGAARAHAEKMESAEQALKLAEAKFDALSREADTLSAREERLKKSTLAAAGSADDLAGAQDDQTKADGEELRASEVLKEAEKHVTELRERLAAAQKAQRVGEARQRAEEVGQQLANAEDYRRQKEAAEALAATLSVTRESLDEAEAAKQQLDELLARQAAQSVHLRFDYGGANRAEIDGKAIESNVDLHSPTEITLPNLGRLFVDPGERGSVLDDEISVVRETMRKALASCAGAGTLQEARKHLTERTGHLEAGRNAGKLLETVAPEGLSTLAARHAELIATIDEASETPDIAPEELVSSLSLAQTTEAEARGTLDSARARLSELRAEVAAADATHTAATEAREEAADALGEPETHQNTCAELNVRIEEARKDVGTRTIVRDQLSEKLPDLETVAALLERARGAVEQATKETAALTQRLAELSGAIGALADEGIEEELEEVRGRRVAAEARADRYAVEVTALKRLQRALEEARSAAREAYFGPVVQELRPLLAILHGDANLEIDDKTLLPDVLTRDGVAEPIDVLSDGTREQIAILTRLAFARLFARRGQTVPIILDDALVHSDDDRIESMFTALHRVARDQQIIVLTCRQRAFAALGGEAAKVAVGTID